MYIDTHTHLDLKTFNYIRENLIDEMFKEYNIEAVVNPAISFESNLQMREKLGKYSNIYYATGIHPTRIPTPCKQETRKRIVEELKRYAMESKNVAIGETGLDLHKPEFLTPEIMEAQEWWFEQHILLSYELALPLILHIRDCEEKKMVDEIALGILRRNLPNKKTYKGVVHCFSSDLEVAKEYIKLGFSIGIGGKITYKNESILKEVVKSISLENILLETDSPFVLPEGCYGKINTPHNLNIIANEIAEIKEVSVEMVEAITFANAKQLFGI